MEDLIKALQILLKYGKPKRPFICKCDECIVQDIDPIDVSQDDIVRLKDLGFSIYNKDVRFFYMTKYC